MKSKIAVLLITVILLNSKSFSQASPGNYLKWGIETELIQPFLPNVGIIRFQVARTLSRTASKMKGDLLLGAYIRPNIKHDVVEKINEYLLITGYRQYLWKGLHLEAKSNIGYAWGTKNLIDGRDYNNFSWFWESNLGYKFEFAKKQHSNMYALAQFGALGSIKADIGPRGGKADDFIQGNLIIGINF